MADINKQFFGFHANIRLDYKTNESLRDKRNKLLERLKRSVAVDRKFRTLLQGSYKMRTGVNPLEGQEPDIDVGLVFDVDDPEGELPAIRDKVYAALQNATSRVDSKMPCIRVNYNEGYHVDIVVYGQAPGVDRPTRLVMRDGAVVETDPQRLWEWVEKFKSKFSETENDGIEQLRRVIRYLKRWDDEHNKTEGNSKPSGLAYTLLACNNLEPAIDFNGRPDDHAALQDLAYQVVRAGTVSEKKPTPGFEDMFGRLTPTDLSALVKRFRGLYNALNNARLEPDPVEACKTVAAVLGRDFPIPERNATGAKASQSSVIVSGTSA